MGAAIERNIHVHCLMLLGRTICGNVAACALSPETGADMYTQLAFIVLKTWLPILKVAGREATIGALLTIHAPVYQDVQ